jgi:hypothetical protein
VLVLALAGMLLLVSVVSLFERAELKSHRETLNEIWKLSAKPWPELGPYAALQRIRALSARALIHPWLRKPRDRRAD